MAVLLPTFEVKIISSSDEVRYVQAISQITVNLSSEKPCDSAEVHVPATKKIEDLEFLKPGKEGSQIEIGFGYIGENAEKATVFVGVIDWISPDLPLVIKAEDAFTKAKRKYFTETYCKGGKRLYYSEIAQDVLSRAGLTDYCMPAAETDLDARPRSMEFKNQTVAQAMAKLSEEIQWVHFCIPGTERVYFGPDWPYLRRYLPISGPPISKVLLYRIGSGRERSNYEAGSKFSPSWGNIISAGSLKYRTDKPYSKAICNLVDREQQNKSVKGEYPETEKEYKTEKVKEGQEFSFTRIYSFDQGKKEAEDRAKELAKRKFHELNAAQYEGSFTTFGNPKLSHSHRFWLESAEHPSRNGYYEAKAVTFNYSPQGGFRTTVEVRKPPDELLPKE
ncbi:hypothetical protein CEE36_08330 [candidate division TA06 bacterium B3_TA06]|uniref:Uncharacterized protein n=1 Tax=candidate division TA06 bacterium B3_TA06 TaxID=2012487 RepID=A0A532V2F5_UNCT6|nr:MAG: hypothetical protein CEE36_08330 [candidate division TA06 bacterium B3_TA06]